MKWKKKKDATAVTHRPPVDKLLMRNHGRFFSEAANKKTSDSGIRSKGMCKKRTHEADKSIVTDRTRPYTHKKRV
jgi:hypothetical protein